MLRRVQAGFPYRCFLLPLRTLYMSLYISLWYCQGDAYLGCVLPSGAQWSQGIERDILAEGFLNLVLYQAVFIATDTPEVDLMPGLHVPSPVPSSLPFCLR
jgi:hypothetical protein